MIVGRVERPGNTVPARGDETVFAENNSATTPRRA